MGEGFSRGSHSVRLGLHSMLSVAEGGVGRVLACIRMRGCLASVIWGDLVKASELRK